MRVHVTVTVENVFYFFYFTFLMFVVINSLKKYENNKKIKEKIMVSFT